MPKAGENTNAEPMNVQEYNAEKFDLLQRIRELFEKIKEAIKSIMDKQEQRKDQRKENKNKKYASVIKRLEKAEKSIKSLETASDVNLDALSQIQTVLAGLDEKLSKLSPDDLEGQMKALEDASGRLQNEAKEQVGKEFAIQGTVKELIIAKLNQKTIEGMSDGDKEKLLKSLDSLPLIKTVDERLLIGIPSDNGGEITRYSEITFSEEEGKSNMIILGEPQEIPNVSYETLKLDSKMSIDEKVLAAVTDKYESPEERVRMLLSQTLSDVDNMKEFAKFQEKYKDVQTNEETSAKYNSEENEFQIYDERSQILLTIKKENDKMMITSYETDEPFVKKGTGTVIREYENKEGTLSIKTNRTAVDKSIMRLLTNPVTNEFLAYFDIDNQNINSRFEKAKELNEKFMSINHFKNGDKPKIPTKAFTEAIQEATEKQKVKVDICQETGGVVADFPESNCRVAIEFSKRGIPSIATVIQGDHETNFVISSPRHSWGSVLNEKEHKVLEKIEALMGESVNKYLENNTLISPQDIRREANIQEKKNGVAYAYQTTSNALLEEAVKKHHIDTSNLEVEAISPDILQIRNSITDSAMTLKLDESGGVDEIEFNHLAEPNSNLAIIDSAKNQIIHHDKDFAGLDDGGLTPKANIYFNMLKIAACLEYGYNLTHGQADKKGLFSSQFTLENVSADDVNRYFGDELVENAKASEREVHHMMIDSKSENIYRKLQEKFPDCNIAYQNEENGTAFTIAKLNGELTVNVDLVKDNLQLCIYEDERRKCTCEIPVENQQPVIRKASITQYDSTTGKTPDELRNEIIADKSIISMIDRAVSVVNENNKEVKNIDSKNKPEKAERD